jgi:hypothetical protein
VKLLSPVRSIYKISVFLVVALELNVPQTVSFVNLKYSRAAKVYL